MDVGQQKRDDMLAVPGAASVAVIRTRTMGSSDPCGHQFHRDAIWLYVCPVAPCRQCVAVKHWIANGSDVKVFRAASETLCCTPLPNLVEREVWEFHIKRQLFSDSRLHLRGQALRCVSRMDYRGHSSERNPRQCQ